ncbi:MAG: Na+-transporting NADH:ubiquinone oxidoreductase subunit F [Patiriisocius sp.]
MLAVRLYKADIPLLTQEQNAAWQISINNGLNTKVTLNAQAGDSIAHLNDKAPWRKFFFKLHFMDYANAGSFNNILIKLFALITFMLSCTGMYWLFELVKDKQFVIP